MGHNEWSRELKDNKRLIPSPVMSCEDKRNLPGAKRDSICETSIGVLYLLSSVLTSDSLPDVSIRSKCCLSPLAEQLLLRSVSSFDYSADTEAIRLFAAINVDKTERDAAIRYVFMSPLRDTCLAACRLPSLTVFSFLV